MEKNFFRLQGTMSDISSNAGTGANGKPWNNTKFKLTVNEGKNADGTTRESHFFITVWNKIDARLVGREVVVEGRLRNRKNDQGVFVTEFSVPADGFSVILKPASAQQTQSAAPQTQKPQPAPQQQRYTPSPSAVPPENFVDDNIPF